MFEQFSRGYYLGRLYVERADTEVPAMCRAQHRQVEEQLYEETDEQPLVMKLDRHHFPVRGEGGVPADTLAVPDDILASTNVRNPPALREVFLAKADRAAELLRFEQVGEPAGI